MTWQLAAFVLLGLALLAGFAWYERGRPDARVVALVGTLAAFAALGRIAFAAVPNVKPTTDIVLIAGFALGSGPGFAVGAIAGLTSNFFFGQGPWTPWQMAAWGATGLLGALLARVYRHTARPIGRWPLAIVCGAAGFAFTAVQDAGNWVIYTDHGVAQLGAYVGQGLGFDTIHAVGCVLFALAFGPALIRSVERFARRIDVTWLPPATAPVLLVAVCAGSLALTGARPPSAHAAAGPAVRAQVAYLEHAQNADGGLGAAPGQSSDPLFAGWGALGLESAGADVGALRSNAGRPSLLEYVAATATGADVGALERTILAAVGAGGDPAHFGGRDLVSELGRRVSPRGAIDGEVNLTAFGLLALRAAGAPAALQARAAGWLERGAGPGGGYGLLPGGDADADDTGAVLEAFGGIPGHAAARARHRAVAWLRRHQDPDGGFATAGVTGSNAQSTAWAVQGLLAAGDDPASLHRDGHTPVAYLRSLAGEDGSVAYAHGQRQTPVWVTAEVLMALDGQPLPLAAPASAQSPAATATATARTRTSTASSTTATVSTTATASTTPTTAPPVTTGSHTTPARSRHVHRGVSRAVTRMAAHVCTLPGLIVAAARIGQ